MPIFFIYFIMEYFHLSESNCNNKVFYPRVPYSTMDDEDQKTKRVCVSTCIPGCIRALVNGYMFDECTLYVHVPLDYKGRVHKPSKKEVPDVIETREKWLLDKVRMKCIGVIRVRKTDKPDPYNSHEKMFKYKWIEKY